jgi:large subunit ribosomal protein L16
MLQPKKQKYRKQFRGKMRGVATSSNEVLYGDYGLKSLGVGWVKARNIEAARRTISGATKRKGKVWLRVFPDKPYTQKPTNSRMGRGKGDVEGYVAVIKPGTILFEIGGVSEEVAVKALNLASHKLPIKTKVITKSEI